MKKKPRRKNTKIDTLAPHQKPVHPWRICPEGHYFRQAHWQSDYTTATGKKVSAHQIRGHCVRNPSGFDQIYPDEIEEIAERYFPKLKSVLPAADKGFKKFNPNQYDGLILGWTKYWNEVLKPTEPLDTVLVKALIESESGYNPKKERPIASGSRIKVHGLMQISDETIIALKDEDGEIKNHYVNFDMNESTEPNLNICAGIRWLFQKKKLASVKLGREATWIEAVASYKGEFDKYIARKDPAGMHNFLEIYDQFKRGAGGT